MDKVKYINEDVKLENGILAPSKTHALDYENYSLCYVVY